MKEPEMNEEKVSELFGTKYIKIYNMEISEGVNYYQASRHKKEDLTILKSDEDFKKMLPDAVTCIVILKFKGEEPKLLLNHEFRYPVGQYLLSPTAGLIDEKDKFAENPLVETARREIFEETGIKVGENDRIFAANRVLFSTPGMSDESNGIVCAVISAENTEMLTHENAEGTELFKDFTLVDRKEARKILKRGTDSEGRFFSVYTWACLLYFCSGLWEEEQ